MSRARGFEIGNVAAVHQRAAAVERDQAGDDVERRRLAAPRGPSRVRELARVDGDVDRLAPDVGP